MQTEQQQLKKGNSDVKKNEILNEIDGRPKWAYLWARKTVVTYTKNKYELTLTNGSCHVKISKGFRDRKNIEWFVYNHGKMVMSQGHRIFSQLEYQTAFNLKRDEDETDLIFTKLHSAEFGIPGQYIRSGNFLNIPCPCVVVERDPNATIFLSEKIRNYMEHFFKIVPK